MQRRARIWACEIKLTTEEDNMLLTRQKRHEWLILYHSVKRKHKHSYSHLTAVLIRGTNRVRQMHFSQAVWVIVPSCPDKLRPMGRMFHSEENTGRAGDYCVLTPNSSQMKMTVWWVEEQTTDRQCLGYSQYKNLLQHSLITTFQCQWRHTEDVCWKCAWYLFGQYAWWSNHIICSNTEREMLLGQFLMKNNVY